MAIQIMTMLCEDFVSKRTDNEYTFENRRVFQQIRTIIHPRLYKNRFRNVQKNTFLVKINSKIYWEHLMMQYLLAAAVSLVLLRVCKKSWC